MINSRCTCWQQIVQLLYGGSIGHALKLRILRGLRNQLVSANVVSIWNNVVVMVDILGNSGQSDVCMDTLTLFLPSRKKSC